MPKKKNHLAFHPGLQALAPLPLSAVLSLYFSQSEDCFLFCNLSAAHVVKALLSL